MRVISRPAAGDMIRRLLLAWLLTGAIQYTCLPASKRVLSGFSALTGQSFPLLLVGTAASFALLTLAGLRWRTAHWERAALPVCFGWQLALGLRASWSVPLLCAGLVVLALLLVYAAYGARTDAESLTAAPACTGRRAGLIIVIIAAAVFLVAVLALTVFRVLSYAAPTYDFGIFSQMFHSMRTTGLPVTTCERDRVLSHFAVHVSPIYYLFLPFYALFPSPVTLEVLQALLLASAVIPLWRIARRHGLSGVTAGLLCALLLLWPAYAGGTSYDVHENKFLTPLLLWLFDFLDRRCVWGVALFSVLTCMVKEDAPVYVAVIALWVVLRALTRTGAERRWGLLTGGAMLVGAVGYFLGVTAWLAADGDGVMSYRYSNFLYDGSDSLFTVIKAVLLSPVRTLRECFEGEKIAFFFLTMGPLLFLPLCTRRYERLVLLINASSYTEDGMAELVRSVYTSYPLSLPKKPNVSVNLYTGTGMQRLYEITLDYGVDEEEQESFLNSVGKLGSLFDAQTRRLDEPHRALAACEYLVANCHYDARGYDSAYSALSYGYAGSEGIALAYTELCRQLGIDCTVVYGQLDWADHCWNVIKLDGDYYHVDVTACIDGGIEAGFLKNDEAMWGSYRWNASDLKPCNGSLSYNDLR